MRKYLKTPPTRKQIANSLVAAGFSAISAGAWAGFGTPAGLAAAGIASTVFGLMFVDVDSERGADGEPPA